MCEFVCASVCLCVLCAYMKSVCRGGHATFVALIADPLPLHQRGEEEDEEEE